MSVDTTLQLDREAVARISQEKGEPAWVAELRMEAFGRYSTLPLPKLEKTKIDSWLLEPAKTYTPATKVAGLNELSPEVLALVDQAAQQRNLLVQTNSSVVYVELAEELAKQGVIFTDMDTAVEQHAELVQKYFNKLLPTDNKLLAYHSSIMSGGVFLYIPKNVNVELPIQAIFNLAEGQSVIAPRVLIVADTHSSVTYVDNYINTTQDAAVQNGAVEIFVGDGARVRYTSVHDLSQSVTDVIYRRAEVGKDGVMEFFVGEMSSGNIVAESTTYLRGNGANSDTTTISIGNGSQRINQTSRVHHFGHHTNSNMVTRSVMRDSAVGIYNGITKIEKGALKSDGIQAENILMLSEKSRGDANPILLVDEEDVLGAGHAASVGQISPEQIFYLTSRGIARPEAERLIVHGFLAPVVNKIPVESLQERLVAVIERKLGK